MGPARPARARQRGEGAARGGGAPDRRRGTPHAGERDRDADAAQARARQAAQQDARGRAERATVPGGDRLPARATLRACGAGETVRAKGKRASVGQGPEALAGQSLRDTCQLMSQRNVEIVRRIYEDANRGDFDAAIEYFAPEIE